VKAGTGGDPRVYTINHEWGFHDFAKFLHEITHIIKKHDRMPTGCRAVGEMRTVWGNRSTRKKKPVPVTTFSITNPM
jgi:hypothetical protein